MIQGFSETLFLGCSVEILRLLVSLQSALNSSGLEASEGPAFSQFFSKALLSVRSRWRMYRE